MLKNAQVLSVMVDGATDVSICENEIVYALVMDDRIPKNLFVKINSVDHANAEGVLAAIESGMGSVDNEGWNWKQKLIPNGSDGASVNLGKCHSVAEQLKD